MPPLTNLSAYAREQIQSYSGHGPGHASRSNSYDQLPAGQDRGPNRPLGESRGLDRSRVDSLDVRIS
jgi:hypothetical protein